MFPGVLAVLTVWFLIPGIAKAQNTCPSVGGNNTIWGPCLSDHGNVEWAGSPAFIDASPLLQGDICTTIYRILNGTVGSYTSGAVLDARGISGSALTCPTNTSPWFTQSGGYLANKPSTILLPAGTITIPYQWILPSGTRLIGQGTDLEGSQQTVIRCSGSLCSSSNAMIQFGGTGTFACPTSPCTGISVEHVTLDGVNSTTVTGIENANSQDQTYVDPVTLWQILGTGLYIHGNAQNSGPYTNITYDSNSAFGVAHPFQMQIR